MALIIFFGGEIQSKNNLKRVKDGTHHFLGDKNPSSQKICCVFCKKETNLQALTRWHSKEKCK